MHQPVDLRDAVRAANTLPGINISVLAAGTELIVSTRNSVYDIFVIDPVNRLVRLSGGQLSEPVECHLTGSTWGGSIIRLGWVGFEMRMEFKLPGGQSILTSEVRRARIIGASFEYQMDWPEAGGDGV
jgi:hypothetical protein